MGEKQYFFRNSEYSNMEMMRRIPIEVLSKDVIGENGLSQSKAISSFLERYNSLPELVTKLNQSFAMHGRKGDFANIRIYDFNKFRYDFLTVDGLNIIKNLKGQLINELPLLASFIEHDIAYFDDVNIINSEYIDYKFKFEYQQIREVDNQLVKEPSFSFVECRHYLKEKIIAVFDSTAYELKAVCGILFSIPYYVNLSMGNPFLYGELDYKQILLNSTQLESIKVLLGGKLKSAVLDMISDKGVKIKIEGNDKDFETNSITLKQNIKNGDKKEVQFYWIDEEHKTNKITIKAECQIISTNYLSEQALKKIIDTILSVDSKREFLIPINSIIDEYCGLSFRKALARRNVENKTSKVINEMTEIINEISHLVAVAFEPSNLYIVISLNIIIQTLIIGKKSRSSKYDFNIREYELYNVLVVYLKHSKDILITESEINNSLNLLLDCIRNAGKEESDLLNAYYSI